MNLIWAWDMFSNLDALLGELKKTLYLLRLRTIEDLADRR